MIDMHKRPPLQIKARVVFIYVVNGKRIGNVAYNLYNKFLYCYDDLFS